MPKTVSSQLLSDIQANVTTLATCIEIIRKDGEILRLTTHDSDLVVAGDTYRQDMPFVLAAIQSGTTLAVDNTQLTLFADETNIFLADFKSGLFEYAAVTIFQVNYNDTSRGTITMRKGWFGQIVFSENHIVQITITGLLKVLDLEVGRVFQPSCDADFGDSRCKVAVQQTQIRSELNPIGLGDWVYYYDPALMTALTVVNPSFEADGVIDHTLSITGWTKTLGAEFQVRSSSGGLGTFSVLDGSYMLTGSTVTSVAFESGLYQDIDVAGQIGGTTDIDDGKISVAFFAGILSTTDVANVWRLKMELMDADGVVLDSQDTRYVQLDAIDSWREKACVLPLLPGTRTVRIWLYMINGAGTLTGACAADRVRMYYWDHTVGSPYSGVVHHATRLMSFDANSIFYMYNGSFEIANVSNANNPTINAWVTGSGNWWSVSTTAFSGVLTSQDGLRFLIGGDDGGSTSNLYEISQVHPLFSAIALNGWALDPARVLLGKYTSIFYIWLGYGDTTSKATIIVDWLNDANVSQGVFTIKNDATGIVGWHAISSVMTVPATATKVKVTLKGRSPTGSGSAKVAFDNVRFAFFDTERSKLSDPTAALGIVGTTFNTSPGDVTFDGGISYKAVLAFTAYDVVSSVVDARKEFVGTSIAGADGTFETGPLRWISGNNAGLRDIIRKWDSGTQTIKLYFRTPRPIQVGDRFYYSAWCQRRFIQDCLLRFGNTLNFRGFPYVPGALTTTPTETAVVLRATPNTGSHVGGTSVIISGSHLGAVTAVSFGAVPATSFSIIDDNTIQAVAPAQAAGTVDIFCTPGTSTTATFIYT